MQGSLSIRERAHILRRDVGMVLMLERTRFRGSLPFNFTCVTEETVVPVPEDYPFFSFAFAAFSLLIIRFCLRRRALTSAKARAQQAQPSNSSRLIKRVGVSLQSYVHEPEAKPSNVSPWRLKTNPTGVQKPVRLLASNEETRKTPTRESRTTSDSPALPRWMLPQQDRGRSSSVDLASASLKRYRSHVPSMPSPQTPSTPSSVDSGPGPLEVGQWKWERISPGGHYVRKWVPDESRALTWPGIRQTAKCALFPWHVPNLPREEAPEMVEKEHELWEQAQWTHWEQRRKEIREAMEKAGLKANEEARRETIGSQQLWLMDQLGELAADAASDNDSDGHDVEQEGNSDLGRVAARYQFQYV